MTMPSCESSTPLVALGRQVRMRLDFGELFERHAVDFAGGFQRHFVEDDDFLRGFIADVLSGEGDQLARSLAAWRLCEGDVGPHVFAVDQIVDADDSGRLDGRVFFQGFLDFLRADVRAIMNDDLFFAAAKPEVAVGIDAHQVARVEPAVDDGLGGGLLVAPIADA